MNKKIINFLPGPVQMYPDIKEAFLEDAYSHRSERFILEMNQLKERLCELTKAKNVQVIAGSGTLANDIIGSQLQRLKSKGLILSNGEFGERLIKQAERLSLTFNIYKQDPGKEINVEDVRELIKKNKDITWIWFVHSETSTGVLNNLEEFTKIGVNLNIKICVDCISSIGNIPLDLSKIFLASGSSNKGLGAFPGIAMVFYNEKSTDIGNFPIPAYLDLDYYIKNHGIPFTISTNLTTSLIKALSYIDSDHFKNIKYISSYLYEKLSNLNYEILGKASKRNPAVFTILLPSSINSINLGQHLLKNDIYVSFESSYLKKLNWIQFSIMGKHTIQEIDLLIKSLHTFQINNYAPVHSTSII